jgi:heptosyltransferase-2
VIPSRLVIRAPNWLGDVVMALPAMAAIRRAMPETSIAIAALPSIAPVFSERTDVSPDDLLTIEPHTERARLGAGRFDAILLLTNSFRTAWIARGAGIGERWGYAAGFRRPLLTRAIARPRARVHQSTYYLELVRALGFDVDDPPPPRVTATLETRTRAAALLQQSGIDSSRPIVGMAPGAAYGHAKRWPPPRVADLIVRLSRERGAVCVLVGAAGDRDAGREIESRLPSDAQLVNLIGRTDLRLLVGILAACRAFVSNDSGAMHLAAAVGVPVTAIFGPTDERATAPIGNHEVLIHHVFCRPCMLRECPIDHRCMNGIDVDRVFAAVTRRLGTPE